MLARYNADVRVACPSIRSSHRCSIKWLNVTKVAFSLWWPTLAAVRTLHCSVWTLVSRAALPAGYQASVSGLCDGTITWTMCRSVRLSAGLYYVHKVYCGKTAQWIRIVLREIPRSPSPQIPGLLPLHGPWLVLYLARSTRRREFSQSTETNHLERVAENWPCQYLA